MKKLSIIEGHLATLMPEGPSIESKTLGPEWEIKNYGVLDKNQFSSIADSDAIIARTSHNFDSEQISILEKAKIIVTIGVGYDHIDIDAAAKKNIPVCNVPDYGTEEVADTTIAMILAHQRKIFLYKHKSQNELHNWDWRIHREIKRSSKLNVGIIGIGRIGTAVAMRLKPFGYNINFYDPYANRGVEKSLGLNRVYDLEELLKNSDIITIHAPFSEETDGMINDQFFNLIKDDAIIINTARGGIFDSLDTIEYFLKNKKNLRIATDVLPFEPPSVHSLLEQWRKGGRWLDDRLIIMPHSAFYSEESCYELRKFSVDIIKTVFSGGNPYNVVNAVYTL